MVFAHGSLTLKLIVVWSKFEGDIIIIMKNIFPLVKVKADSCSWNVVYSWLAIFWPSSFILVKYSFPKFLCYKVYPAWVWPSFIADSIIWTFPVLPKSSSVLPKLVGKVTWIDYYYSVSIISMDLNYNYLWKNEKLDLYGVGWDLVNIY